MSLIGRLNIGDTTSGLFIGTVNINNLDASNNSILYSSDGKRVQGANKLSYDSSGNNFNISTNINASGNLIITDPLGGPESIILTASTGAINASGTITGATITAGTGTVSGGTISGATLNSSGAINASGTTSTNILYVGENSQNWTQYSSTPSWAGYLGVAVSDTKVLVASPFNGIYSTTNGTSWTTEISDFSYWTSCAISGTNMIACAVGGSGVYANLGAGWVQQTGTAPFLSSLGFLSVGIAGTKMITCVNGGSVFTNLTGTWNQETSISTSAAWYGVAISGSNMIACVNFGGVYYNFSGTWVNTGLASYGWTDVGIYGTNMIASSSNGGVWTNFGSGWTQESLSTAFNWNSVSIYDTYMIAAADGGSVWLNTGSGWINQTSYGLTSGIRYFSCDIYNTRVAVVTNDTKEIFARNFLIPLNINASGTITVSDSTNSVIINPSGTINASGTITCGGLNAGSGNITTTGTLSAGTFNPTNISTSGSITSTNGSNSVIINPSGTINASGTITGSTITAGTGTVSGATINSTGNINASGTITGSTITAGTGTVSGATISGSTLNSTGNINASGTITGATLTAGTGTVSGATLNSTDAINASGTITGTTLVGTNLTVNGISHTNMSKYIYNDFSNSTPYAVGASITYFSTIISGFTASKKCIFHISFTFYTNYSNLYYLDLLVDGTSTGTITSYTNLSLCHLYQSTIVAFTPTSTSHTISFKITAAAGGNVYKDGGDNFSYVIYQLV